MKITVRGLDYFDGCLEVDFQGVTSYGENIGLSAKYNRDLKMKGCSSAYSSMNNARYYVEVAQYFQAMLDLEDSSRLRDAFKQVDDIDKKYDDEKDALYDELKKVRDDIEGINNELYTRNESVLGLNLQINQLEKSLKRCTKQSSIEDKQKAIENLKEQIKTIEMMNKNRKDELKKNLTQLKKDKIKIEEKIDKSWGKCRMDIRAIEISKDVEKEML